ncbi:PspC domain-containing protein [Edwardsiella ictaluri]
MSPSLSPRRLYRLPQRGVFKGVCAGIADYFDVPVALVRAMAVVSIFCGLFVITLAAYLILAFTLPVGTGRTAARGAGRAGAAGAHRRGAGGVRTAGCRRLERYVTSPAFSLNRRFRQL